MNWIKSYFAHYDVPKWNKMLINILSVWKIQEIFNGNNKCVNVIYAEFVCV